MLAKASSLPSQLRQHGLSDVCVTKTYFEKSTIRCANVRLIQNETKWFYLHELFLWAEFSISSRYILNINIAVRSLWTWLLFDYLCSTRINVYMQYWVCADWNIWKVFHIFSFSLLYVINASGFNNGVSFWLMLDHTVFFVHSNYIYSW